MTDELNVLDWETLLQNENVENSWAIFEEKFTAITEKHVPLYQRKKGREPWMTRKAEKAVREKKNKFNRYRKHPTPERKEECRLAKNAATKVTRQAQENFETLVAANVKDNPKEFWAYVKSQTGSAGGIAPLKRADNTLAVEDKEKATILSDYFASVFTREDLTHMRALDNDDDMTEALTTLEITAEEVERSIKELKSGKSAGPDGIHPRALKETCTAISAPLSILFNQSIREGTIPRAWSKGTVVPLFKKGNRNEKNNYRPVSLTSVVCKLMERVVRHHVLNFLEDRNYFVACQHGFRKRRSCVTKLLHVLETWTSWIDDKVPFDCVYLDYQKAFDSVPHQRLLTKIQSAGIQGNILRWMESFLLGREQQVRVRNELSDIMPVTSGVPQGSVL